MHVAVAGGAGDLGSAVVRAFTALGVPTTALVHPRTDAWRLADLGDVDIVRVDLLDTAAVAEELRAHRDVVVVDAAGRSGHPGTPGGPSRVALWRDTVLTTVSLLEAVDPENVHSVVHLGSFLGYRPSDRALAETDPVGPVTARGVAKRAAATALWEWAADTGVPCSELVVFRAYGPHESPGRLVPTLVDAVRSDAVVPLVDAETRRDMVYVDDVAETVVRMVDAAAYGVPVNVGSGVASSVPEIVAAFEAASGRHVRVAPGARPARAYDVPHWQADLTRCHQLLGWRPPTTLDEGMERVWASAGVRAG
jgi:nucleoside-diphosphate-sugar epimerase